MVDLIKLSERGYKGPAGRLMAEKLSGVDSIFTVAIDSWLESGIETEFEISGVKLSDLKKKFSLTYPAAILSMDWLLREPECAKRSFDRGIR